MNHHWTDEDTETLRRMYKDCYNIEIARMIGCGKATVDRKIRELGLEGKSEAHSRRKAEKISEKLKGRKITWKAGREKGFVQTEEHKRKSGEAIRALYASERRRVIFGLPQRTRYKVNPWRKRRKKVER